MHWVANNLLRGYSLTSCEGSQYSLELKASNDEAERKVGRADKGLPYRIAPSLVVQRQKEQEEGKRMGSGGGVD